LESTLTTGVVSALKKSAPCRPGPPDFHIDGAVSDSSAIKSVQFGSGIPGGATFLRIPRRSHTGINSAIYTPSGAGPGRRHGFAIPINKKQNNQPQPNHLSPYLPDLITQGRASLPPRDPRIEARSFRPLSGRGSLGVFPSSKAS